jgi:DNA polymerase-3 subunit alpha
MPVTDTFVHLRMHTEYSIVDSVVRIDELVAQVAAAGMPAVAITDQVNLFGLIKFYSAAMSAGVKPICGCDVLIENEDNPQRPTPLVLLVRNKTGYRNLTELISRAYTEKSASGQVTVRREWVAERAEGLDRPVRWPRRRDRQASAGGAREGTGGAAAMDAMVSWQLLSRVAAYRTRRRAALY